MPVVTTNAYTGMVLRGSGGIGMGMVLIHARAVRAYVRPCESRSDMGVGATRIPAGSLAIQMGLGLRKNEPPHALPPQVFLLFSFVVI